MIKHKPKPCKGTGKAKGWGCGKPTPYRVYGLGKMCCYPDWLLNSEDGKIVLAKATLKATKPRTDLEKAEQEDKHRKKLGWLLSNVKNTCHEYIRKRDYGKPCISCGQSWKKDFEAGHFYKAETFSSLKFDEDNIHGQCVGCNKFKDGNESKYRVGLIERYGSDFVMVLDSKATQYKQNRFDWDREELAEIRKKYKTKIKQLQSL